MRTLIIIVNLMLFISFSKCNPPPQNSGAPDSVVLELTVKSEYYFFRNLDSSLKYSLLGYDRANVLGIDAAKISLLIGAGESYREKGNFPRALEMFLKVLRTAQDVGDKNLEAQLFAFIGFTFLQFGDYQQALSYLLPANAIIPSTAPTDWGLTRSSRVFTAGLWQHRRP